MVGNAKIIYVSTFEDWNKIVFASYIITTTPFEYEAFLL